MTEDFDTRGGADGGGGQNFMQRLFEDFNWGKFIAAAAIGAGAGGAYSVFDQTVLHRKKHGQKLPLPTEMLERIAPDILIALDRFYQYRNTVPTQYHKTEFRRCTVELMRQSEYIAALYNRCMYASDTVTPHMEIIANYNQLKQHTKVVVQGLRTMLALVQKDDCEDLELTDAFNRLYACYNNRLFNMEKTFRS